MTYNNLDRLRNILFRTFASGLVIAAFNFGASILIARGLKVDQRGVLAAYQFMIVLTSGLAQLGLAQSFVFAARKNTGFDKRGNSGVALFVTGLLPILITMLFITLYGWEYSDLLLILGGVAFSIYSTLLLLMQYFSNLVRYNLISALYSTIMLIAISMLNIFSGINVESVFLIQISTYGLLTIPMFYWVAKEFYSPNDYRKFDFSGIASLFRVGLGFYGVSIVGVVLSNVDKVFIYFKGAVSVMGLYVIAYTSSRLITLFQNSLATVLYSRFAGYGDEKMEEAIFISHRLTFLPLIFFATALGFFSEPLIHTIYGQEYIGATWIFRILLFEAVIGGASWILAQYFNAHGRTSAVLARQALSIVPVILILPLAPEEHLGESIAIALLAAALLRLITTFLMLKYMFSLSSPRLFPRRSDISSFFNAFKNSGAL